MFFLNIYIYLYISLLFIIYIRMYILQKKDKPRTAVQSISPQTKSLLLLLIQLKSEFCNLKATPSVTDIVQVGIYYL